MSIYNYAGSIIQVDPYINVKDYGAKGDGTTDDATAIQNALDALSATGGTIFFPVGTYAINSTVKFYSNQVLWFDGGAKLTAKSGDVTNLMRAYCTTSMTAYNGTHDVIIHGATFAGGDFTVNNTLFGFAHCRDILIDSCRFVNPYGLAHNFEINSSYNVHVRNCYFNRGLNPQGNGEMIQIDGATYGAWTDDSYTDGTVSKCIEISSCLFENNSGSPAIGNHSGSQQQIRIHDNFFCNLTGERGAINFNSSTGNVDIYNNTFLDCTVGIGSYDASYYIHDNRFTGVTTAITGSTSIAHNNMINGTFTA